MFDTPPSSRAWILRCAFAGLLGVAVPVLVSCGSSGAGLIPAVNAGPLQSDFELVAQTAESGDGTCTATEAAILKTERDFSALPSTVNAGLRNRLHEGISTLRSDALGLCKQSSPQATATSTTPKTTTSTTTTTPTVTQTTPTQSTPTTPAAPSGPGGGTPAPGAGGEVAPGVGSEPGGGAGAGESGAGRGSGGAGAGSQEGGK